MYRNYAALSDLVVFHSQTDLFSHQAFWLVIAGKAQVLSNNINDGSAPFRKHASLLARVTPRPWHKHTSGKWGAATINAISYTCAWQVKLSTVRKAFGWKHQTSVSQLKPTANVDRPPEGKYYPKTGNIT